MNAAPTDAMMAMVPLVPKTLCFEATMGRGDVVACVISVVGDCILVLVLDVEKLLDIIEELVVGVVLSKRLSTVVAALNRLVVLVGGLCVFFR